LLRLSRLAFLGVNMKSEPSDPVERADERRKAVGSGDVTENADGTIEHSNSRTVSGIASAVGPDPKR
jgi:hypothetical protein